ncbi:MAG: hypothetical protein ACRDCE_17975 [Cetobacterium sp.]|uniref:hypothetical protein n=1 Tax=Cetobacterium sp. TaxID=2071632 RepID=UPI003EE7076E
MPLYTDYIDALLALDDIQSVSVKLSNGEYEYYEPNHNYLEDYDDLIIINGDL